MTLDEVLETFESFYDYETNWNGEGSTAPSHKVISNALAVYGLTQYTGDVSITVTDEGSIKFNWELAERNVQLDVFDYSARINMNFNGDTPDVNFAYSPIAFKSSFIAEDLNACLNVT